jgi:hypothetical protein
MWVINEEIFDSILDKLSSSSYYFPFVKQMDGKYYFSKQYLVNFHGSLTDIKTAMLNNDRFIGNARSIWILSETFTTYISSCNIEFLYSSSGLSTDMKKEEEEIKLRYLALGMKVSVSSDDECYKCFNNLITLTLNGKVELYIYRYMYFVLSSYLVFQYYEIPEYEEGVRGVDNDEFIPLTLENWKNHIKSVLNEINEDIMRGLDECGQ